MEHQIVQQLDIFYDLNKNNLTAVVINSPNAHKNIFIPSLIIHESQEYKIIGIKEESFRNNQNIQSIKISDDSFMRSIGKNAFSNSTLKKLIIPSSIVQLDDGWCHGTCKLDTVTISSSNKYFKYLDDNEQIIVGKSGKNEDIFDTIVFANRNIEQVTIPNFIKYIKPNAFEYCDKLKAIEISENSNLISLCKNILSFSIITDLFIPASVEVIENGWCRNAYNLTTVTVSPLNKQFKYLNGDHKIIVGKSDKNGDIFDTIVFANRDIEQVTIPNFIKYIKPNAFEYCDKLKAIEISENSNLISLCKNIIRFTSITNFFIPASVEVIENGWCNYVENLKTVTISPSNKNFKYLDDNKQVIIGKSDKNKEVFDTIIFANRDIKQVTIPNFIKYINSSVFENCNQLNAIEIPEDTELFEIGKRAFADSSLKVLNVPKSVTKIHKYAFNSCNNLQKVFIEERSELKLLSERLFSFCENLVQVKIPENSSLKKICKYAFFVVNSIENFFIPSNVEEIEDEWCSGAEKLKTVTVSPLNKNFKYLDDNKQIIVGKSDRSKEVFDTIFFANRDIKQVTIPNYIKYIKPSAFEYCRSLSNFEFQNDSKIRYIYSSIFYNSSIESFFIPPSVEYIHDYWSTGAAKLKTVTVSPLNKNYKYLDDNEQIIVGKSDKNKEVFDTIIFANRNVKQVTIPNFIKYIKPYAFENCNELNTVEFLKDSELASIGSKSFINSTLKEITIPKSVTTIGNNAFSYCRELRKFSLEEGSNLLSLKRDLFFCAKKLETIEIPENSSLKKICSGIIYDSSVQTFFIPSNVEEIEDGWYESAEKLKTVTVSPLNKNFKYLDDNKQVIIGKSDKNKEVFDTIIFANRDIKQVTIPNFIKYIKPKAFENCKLHVFEISDDSKLESFNNNLFTYSSIESLFIPASVKKIEDRWCFDTPKLFRVTISPLNKNYKYLDDNEQIIVEKSDPNKEVFDTIIFANRDIQQVTIPSYIKHIKPAAFKNCTKLSKIEFSKDSELVSIDERSFSFSGITSITIPKSVCEIKLNAFYSCKKLTKFSLEKGSKLISMEDSIFSMCHKLKTVEIPEESSLQTICDSFISFTGVKKIFIPSSVKNLEKNWCIYSSSLKTVEISPLNTNFKYLDGNHQIIVGKSDINSDVFDTIVFANRGIQRATIPKFIKCIKTNAFENCDKLKIIEIPDDSEITSFGRNSFSSTALTNFKVPRKINRYENDFLRQSKKIYCLEFLGDCFVDDNYDSIFNELVNLFIVSFPNVKELNISINKLRFRFKGFILLVTANIEIK